ncbi:MAG: tetratricopeptide repeat protein [Mucilaginibacter sp.]|nr:tetratricopeptide repeat protein [Mucilaginibacter sp.]
MKLSTLLLSICFFSISTATFAQKTGLINSGEILTKGAKLHDSTQYKQALKLYDQITRNDTNYVRSLYERALTCEADSQFIKAIDYCKEALALKDKREFEPDIYAVYGSTLIDMHKYDEGIKVSDMGIAKYPQKANLYFNKALALSAQGRMPEAEAIFQKTLLINPYLYSAHYWLAYVAVKQGKIVPAFLSCVAYLLMNPDGRYFQNSLNVLNAISKSTDEILGFKNKRSGDAGADYQVAEEILLSKIALDKQYKPIIALDDDISRQIQVVFEKLDYDPQSKDFYIQYYMPYFKKLYKEGKFELLINSVFSNADVAIIKDYNKKNKKALGIFLDEAGTYFNLIRSTQVLKYSDRDTVIKKLEYEEGKLVGKGQLANNGKMLVGPWLFYYPAGNLKSVGQYSQTGERTGEWRYYYFDGTLKSIQHWANGKLSGVQDYYYDNGNLSSHETQLNGQLDGAVTTYYYGGAKKLEGTYKAGKKNGIEKSYYANGNFQKVYNYANGELSGPGKEFYKDGSLKETGNYVADKIEGVYKLYNETGGVSAEINFVKGKAEGAWKSYYENGTDKEKRNYVGQVEDGLHQSYYANGQLSETYNVKKGKTDGEMIYYSKTGKVYSVVDYENDVIKAVKYLDPQGKQLFASSLKNNLIDIITFNAAGVKTSHVTYNNNGELTGPDTIFYPSGKVKQIKHYVKGKQNGLSTTYYLNGKKKSEINMTDDAEDGYYQAYHVNGQLQTEGWMKNGSYEGQ